ncbi:MAG TPA: hypothetical protein VKY65_14785 [Alphaproteobacteria bacterium]|nr:hypothetical protein [Alphaproteobacteria bacterium]
MKVPSWVKPGIWGIIIGAIGWWIVLAYGFGWMSAGTAKQMADNQAQSAVVAAVTPYCVQRFEQQPNAVTAWKALKKSADNYNQSDFVQKGGWVALPGQKLSDDVTGGIANACATQLLALKELDGVKLSSAK